MSERCPYCDRDDCAAWIGYPTPYDPQAGGAGDADCAAHAIDWRTRCLAAEADRDKLGTEVERLQHRISDAFRRTGTQFLGDYGDAVREIADDFVTLEHGYDKAIAERDGLRAALATAQQELDVTRDAWQQAVRDGDLVRARLDAAVAECERYPYRARDDAEDRAASNVAEAILAARKIARHRMRQRLSSPR